MSDEALWKVGQKLELVTFDDPDGDLRELDGTTVEVLEVDTRQDPYGFTKIKTQYGDRWVDPFALTEGKHAGT